MQAHEPGSIQPCAKVATEQAERDRDALVRPLEYHRLPFRKHLLVDGMRPVGHERVDAGTVQDEVVVGGLDRVQSAPK